MYFTNRFQAGRMLASRLSVKYKDKPCVVLAVNEGGAIVGAQIAKELHCILNLLISEAVGSITSDGDFTYNPMFTQYDLDEIESEYRTGIEEEKLSKIRQMAESMASTKLIKKSMLVDHNIIVVSDGLKTAFPLELARTYLKPVRMGKLIVATPIASVSVVDWMHIYADEIYCLSVVEEYTETDRYYYKNDVPPKKEVINTVANLVHNWV